MDRVFLTMLEELDARNRDNVSRTAAYLELYRKARDRDQEYPWLLLAHLVSRNAGYMMGSLRRAIDDPRRFFEVKALTQLFLMMERANFLIFYDAWHHLLKHLMRQGGSTVGSRTTAFMRSAYPRFDNNAHMQPLPRQRSLVVDLITNEQHLIENRVVHSPDFLSAISMVRFFESVGADKSLQFGERDTEIRVGNFASLKRRIATGIELYDAMLNDPKTREHLFVWASTHPHTGCRSDYGAKPSMNLRDAWPAAEVQRLAPTIHHPPEPDPSWP